MDFLEWLKSFNKPARAPAYKAQNPDLASYVNGAYDARESDPVMKNYVSENTAVKNNIPSWLDSLFKSPLADSLYSTSQMPKQLYSLGSSGDVLGRYEHETRKLGMNSNKDSYPSSYSGLNLPFPADGRSPESSFVHEMGHSFQASPKSSEVFTFVSSPQANNKSKSVSVKTAHSKLDKYSQDSKHPEEMKAQAFVNAFRYLSETAKDPQLDFRRLAGDLEGNTPGMGMIVQDLIKLPLYQNHPLRAFFLQEKK